MILIGLAGWGEHDDLYENIAVRDKLAEYSAHFPIVEVDTSFYAIQPVKMQKNGAVRHQILFVLL